MQIEKVGIDTLVIDPKNARKHGVKNLLAIKSSIEKFGAVEPLVVRRANRQIIGGNGRYEVLKDLGHTEVEVVFLDISYKKAEALGVILNQTSTLAEWNMDILLEKLDDIKIDFNLKDFGFDESLLDKEPPKKEEAGIDYKNIYEVVIECASETEQETTYNDLTQRGYKCRVLSM